MTPSIEVFEPGPGRDGVRPVHRIQALVRPASPGLRVEVTLDDVPVRCAMHASAGALNVNGYGDTRGAPPGLHRLRIHAHFPDGGMLTHEQFVETVTGEPQDLPPAPELPGVPDPPVCRTDAPELGDRLAQAAADGMPLILLDPDAELMAGALRVFAQLFATGGADVVIGDEASPVGHRWIRWRKPNLSPEALPCLDQVGPLLGVGPRAAALLCDRGVVTGDLYGMALELLDSGLVSIAARRVLVTTPQARLPVDDDACHAAVARLAARRGRRVEVTGDRRLGLRDVRWPVEQPAPVVAVVPSRTPELAARCLRGLADRTDHPALQAVLVGSGPEQKALRAVADASGVPTRYVEYPSGEAFNYQRAVNLGCAAAPDGDVLFLNDDVHPLERADWLTRMAELLSLPGVGIVGALLRYPDGRVQHGGVRVEPHPEHCGYAAPPDFPGRHFDLLVPNSPEAVTGACVLVRRAVLAELGGHDERYVHIYGDIDLCLRAGELGWRTAWCAAAELEHAESLTYAGHVEVADVQRFTARWPSLNDPLPRARMRL